VHVSFVLYIVPWDSLSPIDQHELEEGSVPKETFKNAIHTLKVDKPLALAGHSEHEGDDGGEASAEDIEVDEQEDDGCAMLRPTRAVR
jgi:hypothetical protein